MATGRTAYIGIGSNLGKRRYNIRRAVDGIRRLENVADVVVSSIFVSEPWGYESANKYFNVVAKVVFDVDIEPLWLLDRLQEIERGICKASHRDADGNYIDRRIDIDIIAIDDLVVDHPRLQVPHPLMLQRDFVMRPLEEIAPDWQPPKR
ncbi:MAG: 2-amino-4-hydroxy-6-hydroxymethyldihydropteridine diphosphokinase [Muribaculaceae bacterium]|nr:2-amino-4-hydroxy-6-hydroxymethyldihydropteridine diphosphokinase [Muribaculaceae bacterium]MBR5744738.1 2-amino-4-hydroxy-6-hydroxymethyldihydropteridine diphosphokinase [Muribaculaceae bacterium]